jgi:hypothetical protein
VGAILQGIAASQQQEMHIPAFTLFLEGRFADLMDVLLPAATQEFRDACVQLLYQQFSEDTDEGDDEDDEESPGPG